MVIFALFCDPVVLIDGFFFFTVLGGEFLKYMEAFKPFLGIGLKNYAEYQVSYAFQKYVYILIYTW